MEAATLIGIISAFALVITAIMLGSGLSVFFDAHSLMIVFGGTFGATMINYPIRDVLGEEDHLLPSGSRFQESRSKSTRCSL